MFCYANYRTVKLYPIYLQVQCHEIILRIKKVIVQKEQEKGTDIIVYLYATLYTGYIECRDKPTSHCVTNLYTHGDIFFPYTHHFHNVDASYICAE